MASMGIIRIAQTAGYRPPRIPNAVLKKTLNNNSSGLANRLTRVGQWLLII